MNKKIEIPPSGKMKLFCENVTPIEVQKVMADLIRQLAASDQVTSSVATQIGDASKDFSSWLKLLANFAYYNAYFEPDPPTRQIIRTPAATLRDKAANCVDYTILIGAVAARAGLPVIVRIVQLPGQQSYGHVYPVVNGVAVDVVPCQDQTGREVFTRHPWTQPSVGSELKFLSKFDLEV